MEHVENGYLTEHILKVGKINELKAGEYFWQILDALEYLHQAGIAHRGLCLNNILLDRDYNIKLIDSGFAEVLSTEAKVDNLCGSIAYLAP